MTPDQLERLVRLEEQFKNVLDENKRQSEIISDMSEKVDKMAQAINTAAAFGRGSLWAFTKMVAVMIGIFAVLDWVAQRIPFFKE